ncbi:sulfatase-like hydrolase/transferase [Coraliomargarita sp. SDUM461003]|uniref:Sulfatase-like hydrolase/transferase n=1 Tax=Thalassobacterium maritimum TaxID=3041265 RepID=A0ABU1AQE4_9BACT|nr:sulfatase-like hydrolase/transferase [Coraliomargarita sp. SDUM461003]MDQ8206389.1 sulfatase-like hydrolase/transferase [Coraliomargarita sp. SDUM461003]
MKAYYILALAVISALSSLLAQASKRPNIIFFLADDLGYGDLGAFWQDQRSGIKKFDRPGLDRMAAEGAKLTHHYIAAPVCAPSPASCFQGRHQGNADVRNNQFDYPLPDNINIDCLPTRHRPQQIVLGMGRSGAISWHHSSRCLLSRR